LKRFREVTKKKKYIWTCVVFLVFFLAVIFLYRSYAIYQEKQEFDVIKGSVPNQDYDVMLSYYVLDENGGKNFVSQMPEGKDYEIQVVCDNGALGNWNYDSWKVEISSLKTRTKCNLFFSSYQSPLNEFGIHERILESGAGIYQVLHENDVITADVTEEQKQNLKQVEYRYAGQEVNNYVQFNNELWRIIGLVNTLEGQRIKLIHNTGIGYYSWDSSETSVNSGWGVNSWKDADAMKLLNSGGYYHRTTDICFNDYGNGSVACDFSNIGLLPEAREMIDTITWNVGSDASWYSFSASNFYEAERSNHSSKICNGGNHCNDNVVRSTLWNGQVGLVYPSDYGYATSGGGSVTREMCLSKPLRNWQESRECFLNDWLFDTNYFWSMFSGAFIESSNTSIFISHNGAISNTGAANGTLNLRPVIYLKPEIKISDGNGTKMNPYILLHS